MAVRAPCLWREELERWNFTVTNPANSSRTYTSKERRIPVHTLTVWIYSTSSMLIRTQVRTNFLVCCTFLMVPSWSCVNILCNCQKMCQEWRGVRGIWPRTYPQSWPLSVRDQIIMIRVLKSFKMIIIMDINIIYSKHADLQCLRPQRHKS